MVRSSSDLFAALAQVGQDGVDAVLVDRAQALGGNAQLHPAVLGSNPEAALVEVGHETAAGLVHRMRDVVAARRALAGDLADSGHKTPQWVADRSAWGLYLARKAFGPAVHVGIHGRRAIRERCRGMRRLAQSASGIALPGADRAGFEDRQGAASRALSPSPRQQATRAIYGAAAAWLSAMKAWIRSSSTGRGTEPRLRTAWWKAGRSKSSPSAASASRRSSQIFSSPSL